MQKMSDMDYHLEVGRLRMRAKRSSRFNVEVNCMELIYLMNKEYKDDAPAKRQSVNYVVISSKSSGFLALPDMLLMDCQITVTFSENRRRITANNNRCYRSLVLNP